MRIGGSDEEVVEAPAFFNPEQLLVVFLYMDVMTVCLLAFHLGFLFRLIGVGVTHKHLAKDGQFILQSKPWMRRATFLRAGGLCLVSVADQSSATTGGPDGFRIAPSVVNDKSDTTCMCACLTF